MTQLAHPDWLTRLAGADLDQLFVWEEPRMLLHQRPPPRVSITQRHKERWLHAQTLRHLAPVRWIPCPSRPAVEPSADGGRPRADDYSAIAWALRRRPGRWAVVYVGDRSTAEAVRSAVRTQQGGFVRRGGVFTAAVRAAGAGLFQTHARFTPQ